MFGVGGSTLGDQCTAHLLVDPVGNLLLRHLSKRLANRRGRRSRMQQRDAAHQAREAALAVLTFQLFVLTEH